MNETRKKLVALVPVSLMLGAYNAQAQAVLPDLGVDPVEFATLGLASIAAVVGVYIGGKIALKVVKRAITWIGSMFSG